jgi:hypothetical protein
MPLHEDIQSVSEHQLYKTLAPLVSVALIGIVGWLLTSIMDLENKALRNEQSITVIQNDSEDVWDDIESLQRDVTNIRIHIGNGYNNPHDK